MKTPFVLAALLAVSLAQAQPKPANQITAQDIQTAMDRELHVADAAMVQTCSTQFPELTKPIAAKWQAMLKALPADVVAYRKTPQFSQSLREYAEGQAAEARKPENRKMLQGMCRKMAE